MPKITKAVGPTPPPEGHVQTGEGSFDNPESDDTEAVDLEQDAEADDSRRDEYEALTVGELRDALQHRQLSTTGVKAELVDRLLADDAEYEAEERL